MKDTKVISTFPGCGKTYCYNKYLDSDIIILDSDSSNFSWVKDENGNNTKTRNPDFPENYIKYIRENIGEADIIFVSSHDVVRKALEEHDIDYFLVYPHSNKECKDSFIDRYKKRNSPQSFINFISENYEKFISDMKREFFPYNILLDKNETIDDLLTYGYCEHMVARFADTKIGCPIECDRCPYRNKIL